LRRAAELGREKATGGREKVKSGKRDRQGGGSRGEWAKKEWTSEEKIREFWSAEGPYFFLPRQEKKKKKNN